MEQNVAETEFVSKGEFLHQEVNVLVHLEAVEVVRITLKQRSRVTTCLNGPSKKLLPCETDNGRQKCRN